MDNRDQVLSRLLSDLSTEALRSGPQHWWQNRRDSGGFRLSAPAHKFLQTTTVPRWNFELDPTWITPRNMLRMDRLIPVPYSIDITNRPRRAWVTVWDSGQAMTIELMGDFDRFLAALERAWSRPIVGKC